MFVTQILKYFDLKIGLTTAKAGRNDQHFFSIDLIVNL